jgi:hypothetical protein
MNEEGFAAAKPCCTVEEYFDLDKAEKQGRDTALAITETERHAYVPEEGYLWHD